ncbi:MAG: hypothetical protein K8S16_16790, partial [Bacteroidales bacterium]|nr:hypothetical protein [Bacteroidales bacterium]
MNKKITRFLLSFLIAFWLLISFQFTFRLVSCEPLAGFYFDQKAPVVSMNNWFNQSIQKYFNAYTENQLGFRPLYVRLYNQLQFSLFRNTNNKKIIIGYNNYLFEKDYINAYTGVDFVGKEKAHDDMKRLKSVVRFLKSNNTEFIFVIAPSKAYYFEEYIPSYLIAERSQTNYAYYS